MGKQKSPTLVQKIEKHLEADIETIIVVAVVAAVAVFLVFTWVLPGIKHMSMTPRDRCMAEIEKLNDDDAVCDDKNEIQSKRELAAIEAEELRRASLTPKERCEEDDARNAAINPEYDYGVLVLCDDDGNARYVHEDELRPNKDELAGTFNDDTECNIKGNISYSTGEKIYHVPGGEYYADTVISTEYGERWFCSEEEARAAGWRKSYY